MKKNLIISGAFMAVILLGLSFVDSGVDQSTQVSQVRRVTEQKTEINLEAQTKNFVNYINSLSEKGNIKGIGTLEQQKGEPIQKLVRSRSSRSLSCDLSYVFGGSAYTLQQAGVFGIDPNNQVNTVSQPPNAWVSSAHAVFQDKLFVFGGKDSTQNPPTNEVWYFDGVNWVQFDHNPNTPGIQNAPWSERLGHTASVYNGQVWIIGGNVTIGGNTLASNEVWSFDGTNWTQHPNAPFSLLEHSTSVYNGQIWIFGGTSGGVLDYNNEVWSFDGTNWTQHPNAPWSERVAHKTVVYGGQVWITGGYEGVNSPSNEVWSFDGTNWTQHPNASWSARYKHSMFVHNNKIFVAGGLFMQGFSILNSDEVWSFDGVNWVQENSLPEGIHSAGAGKLNCQRDLYVQKIGSLFQNNVAGFLIQVTNDGLTTETYYLADVLPDDIDIFYVGSNDPNAAYLTDNTSYPFNLAFFAGTIAPGQTFDFYVFTEPIIGQGGLTFNNIAIVSTASTPDDNPGNDISFWPISLP